VYTRANCSTAAAGAAAGGSACGGAWGFWAAEGAGALGLVLGLPGCQPEVQLYLIPARRNESSCSTPPSPNPCIPIWAQSPSGSSPAPLDPLQPRRHNRARRHTKEDADEQHDEPAAAGAEVGRQDVLADGAGLAPLDACRQSQGRQGAGSAGLSATPSRCIAAHGALASAMQGTLLANFLPVGRRHRWRAGRRAPTRQVAGVAALQLAVGAHHLGLGCLASYSGDKAGASRLQGDGLSNQQAGCSARRRQP
jgi:hypothetical protein